MAELNGYFIGYIQYMGHFSSLQAAIYKLLAEDTVLSSKVNGVFSYVPEDTKCPYIYLGEIYIADLELLSCEGYSIKFDISVFSDAESSRLCLDITDRLKTVLESYMPNCPPWKVFNIKVLSIAINKLKQNLMWRGCVIFEIQVINNHNLD